MGDILNKINIDIIEEVEIDVDELTEEYSSKLHELNILLKESPSFKSNATFDSDVWIFYQEDTNSYGYLKFRSIIDKVKLNLIDNEDYKLFKCWIVDILVDNNFAIRTLCSSYVNKMIDIFEETNGFKKEIIKTKKGNLIKTFIDYSDSNYVKNTKIRALESYANFLERIGLIDDGYEILIKTVLEYKLQREEGNPRELPSSRSIFIFDYCIKDFFKRDNDPTLKKIYYPIYIWWKVTNVIPMRPTELITKTTRDCLIKDGDKYYLKVNRVKVKRTRHTLSKPMIPILNKLEINKDTYDLIKKYINLTDFAPSYTLFSWMALNEFKQEYMETKTRGEGNSSLPIFNAVGTVKHNALVFSRNDLYELLSSFYRYIIGAQYGYNFEDKERLTPGDTRHLAFSSLHLQGLSPIEIAMLGGHTTLEMQDSYTNHVQYFVDNEVLNYLSDKSTCGADSKLYANLKEIVFNKPWGYSLGLDLSRFEKTDDGIGYCLLDAIKENGICDNVPYCAFCSKWWCEPTNNSYETVAKYISEQKITPLQSEIKVEEEFFKTLIKEAKFVNLNGLTELEKNDDEALKSQSLKLRAKANKLAFLKISLLEKDFEKKSYDNKINYEE